MINFIFLNLLVVTKYSYIILIRNKKKLMIMQNRFSNEDFIFKLKNII